MCFFRKRRKQQKAQEAEMAAKQETQIKKAEVVEPKVYEPKPQVEDKKVEVKEEPKVVVKEEVKPVVKEEIKPAPKEEVKPAVKKETTMKPQDENEDESLEPNGTKTPKIAKYHVSQNKDEGSENFKKWRVRKEGSTKTIKFFDTQKEAITFAEGLAETAGSSVVIHKVDGSIRKQDYTKKE